MPTDIMDEDIPCSCTAEPHDDQCTTLVVRKLQDRVAELEAAARPFVWDRPYRVDDGERLYLSVSGAQMRRLEHAVGTRTNEEETTYLMTEDEQAVLQAVAARACENPSGTSADGLTAGDATHPPVGTDRSAVSEVLRALSDAGLLLEVPTERGVSYRPSDAAHHYLAGR